MNDRDALGLLEGLVRIPSPSCAEAEAAGWLVARMQELGLDAEVDEVGNAVGRLGDAGPRLALVGHIDTVPGEIPVRIEAGSLFGRGSVDAKGCLATFLAATVRAKREGRLTARVEIVGCVEEEVPSSRGARFRATQPAPDALIVGEPSGAHAITTGYKGFLAVHMTRRQGLAHTAGPESSVAALACRHYVELEAQALRFGGPEAPLYDQLLLHLARIGSSDDGIDASAELELRLRLPPALAPDEALAWLAECSPEWSIEHAGGVPAWSGPRTSPLCRSLSRAIAGRGTKPRFLHKTGTADLNVLAPAWGCPSVAYGPGDSAQDHTPNEHLELAQYFESIEVLTALLGMQGSRE